MPLVSVIVPACHEPFLQKTVSDILAKATGDIEVIVVLDGYWPDPCLQTTDPRLHILHRGEAHGLRAASRDAIAMSHGDYILKLDAHCMIASGMDEALVKDCEPDWCVVPSKYSLEPIAWERFRAPWNAFTIDWMSFDAKHWPERPLAAPIDDLLTFQGSCWFMPRTLWNRIGPLDASLFGQFYQENMELALKVWLSGGRCAINTQTWYAHLHKGKQYRREFKLLKRDKLHAQLAARNYWLNDRWPGQMRPFAWLIDALGPLPGWPDDWQTVV